MSFLAIAIGGAMGALTRFLIDEWVTSRTSGQLPWGILVINMLGSFAAGLIAALVAERVHLEPSVRPLAVVGFLGAFTTFSTLMVDSWRLIEGGAWLAAGLNLVGSVTLGMLAVLAGVLASRLVP